MEDNIYDEEITTNLAEHYQDVLVKIGEDPSREGLEKTPVRVAKAMQYLTQGYDQNPDELVQQAIFHEE